MAESENFEEDLFADLYTEDDNATKPTPVVSEMKVVPTLSTEVNVEDAAAQVDQNGDQDHEDFSEEQDMDDEIDFNLGNSNNNSDAPANDLHGTGIKEDG